LSKFFGKNNGNFSQRVSLNIKILKRGEKIRELGIGAKGGN
jgi:hypothetical protein